jgi:hypothetical protein
MTESTKSLLISILVIHTVFAVHVLVSLPRQAMASNEFLFLFFYPQYLFMWFLPPAYPIHFGGEHTTINWIEAIGKILLVLPVSAPYGLLIWPLISSVRSTYQRRQNRQATNEAVRNSTSRK